jgi:hypothetical protein
MWKKDGKILTASRVIYLIIGLCIITFLFGYGIPVTSYEYYGDWEHKIVKWYFSGRTRTELSYKGVPWEWRSVVTPHGQFTYDWPWCGNDPSRFYGWIRNEHITTETINTVDEEVTQEEIEVGYYRMPDRFKKKGTPEHWVMAKTAGLYVIWINPSKDAWFVRSLVDEDRAEYHDRGGRDKELARNLISMHFPAYSIVQGDDVEPDALASWEELSKSDLPGLVATNLIGNSDKEYAMIIESKSSDKPTSTLFVVAYCTTSYNPDSCKFIFQQDISGYSGIVYLREIPPGETIRPTGALDSDEEETTLSHSAIEVAYFGKGSVAYYWDAASQEMKTITTSD